MPGSRPELVEGSEEGRKETGSIAGGAEKFKLLFEKAPDPALVMEGDIFVECNEAAVRCMRCPGKKSLIGLHPSAISMRNQPDGRSSSQKARELMDKALRDGVVRFDWKHRTFDGDDLWVDVSLVAIPMEGKSILYTVWRDITRRKKAQELEKAELGVKSAHLEEMNAALKVLINERKRDSAELEEKIVTNINRLVVPYIEKLKKCSLPPYSMTYVDIIEDNLRDLVSPFLQKLGLKCAFLTPTEMRIADLIRSGRSTKQIAEVLNMEPGAVNFHRTNIRKKLGINKVKINLMSYLSSL
ncbi:MAG: LuxR C-terminal-related transcriptional regulator [Syntrophorhabdaceae bacterium]|nr:LuxR C-terminal-related transcriptional regulator [Syntrophorhabdaceae bacterium]